MGGGKLSMSKIPSDVELAIQRAKRQPGPGSYHIEHCPLLRPIGSALGGGKISGSQIKSDIEWSMQRAKQQPGPLDYFPDEHTRVLGGRISGGRIKSDVDMAIARASDTPGPGEYYPNLLSIGWRYGGLPHIPSIATRKAERQIHTIPPEARRRPRPTATPAPGDSASRARSASSLGHAGGPAADDPSGPGYGADPGAGSGRAGLPPLRARSVSPTSWVLPRSAAAAYGVRASADKPRKRRRNVCSLRVEVERFRVLPSAFDLARAAEAQAQVPRRRVTVGPHSAAQRSRRRDGRSAAAGPRGRLG